MNEEESLRESERHARLSRLFGEAREVEPEQLDAWLEEHCGDDPELGSELASLLECHHEAAEFLDPPLQEAAMARTLAKWITEESGSDEHRADLDWRRALPFVILLIVVAAVAAALALLR